MLKLTTAVGLSETVVRLEMVAPFIDAVLVDF